METCFYDPRILRQFSVLIPYKAHSSATMIALGADEIVMNNLSELSRIDPSPVNMFNPLDPTNSQDRIPLSVEDVMAYFDLAKNIFVIKGDGEHSRIFTKFTESNPRIHPLALGYLYRMDNLIRILAKRLLKSHRVQIKENEIEKIVDYFMGKLYTQQYVIGRKEAEEELGIKTIVTENDVLSKAMNDLYENYNKEFEFGKMWSPENELGVNAAQTEKKYKIAFVESSYFSNYYEISAEYRKQQVNVLQ